MLTYTPETVIRPLPYTAILSGYFKMLEHKPNQFSNKKALSIASDILIDKPYYTKPIKPDDHSVSSLDKKDLNSAISIRLSILEEHITVLAIGDVNYKHNNLSALDILEKIASLDKEDLSNKAMLLGNLLDSLDVISQNLIKAVET